MTTEPVPGLRVSVGVSGAGKTFGIRSSVYSAARHHPVIVIDRMREWTTAPRDIPAAGARTVADAVRAIEAGTRLVILRAPTVELDQAAELACAWARDAPYLAGVAIPEAHNIAPSGAKLSPALSDVATAWRHFKVALWLDTQRFALLSRTLTDTARELRLYALVGDRDLSVVRELGGPALAANCIEAAARLSRGEAGWHTRLGLVRVPPFELER